MARRFGGPPKVRIVSKIRRSRQQAYTEAWPALKAQVKQRDRFCCRDCGAGPLPASKLEVHHIIPVSRGGRTITYNLKSLCGTCHSKQPFHNHLR